MIHTNLLIVWVLTGFMGATYWLVPEESRTELHSPQARLLGARALDARRLTAVVGYLFGWTAGNKLLEQPLPVKLAIVVVMLMFLYNIGMTIRKAGRLHDDRRRAARAASRCAAVLYLPALLTLRQLHGRDLLSLVDDAPLGRGRVGDDPGRFLAYLLIRLSGADREVMEKWLYVIVGLVVHRRHPRHRAPLLLGRRARATGCRSAASSARSSRWRSSAWRSTPTCAMRRSGLAHPNRWRCTGRIGSAVFTLFGAGLLGLAHTWPGVNKWTHGTLITAMHGHAAFFGAYVMIVLAMITYALPAMTRTTE